MDDAAASEDGIGQLHRRCSELLVGKDSALHSLLDALQL